MFQRTLRQLSIMNSVVFLLIFIVFGTVIYGYVSYRLYDKVDDSMRFKAGAFKIANGRLQPLGRGHPLFDPRIIILLRDPKGHVRPLVPGQNDEFIHLAELVEQAEVQGLQMRELENHIYRIESFHYLYEDRVLNTERGPFVVKDVIAVSIVDSEVASLRDLLLIIVGGMLIGMLIIILAGYYLAKRAMVPIEKSWEKQQQFVADASHELRTPLAVIQSNAELMLRHPGHTVEEESIRVTNIVREVRRMTKLIADLLTLARSDANQAELQLGPVDVNELLDTLAEQFQPMAELKGLELEFDIWDTLELNADRERLYQLLVILLDNAVKYTPPPGKILVSGRKQGNAILLTVQDSGYGIPPEDVPHVFDRFYRGDKARSRETGGTGLGLAIAKWIVEKHGGKIRVESIVGTGTTFSILLPAKAACRVH